MNAKKYADENYPFTPTFHRIAFEAFEAGKESAKPVNIKKLEDELVEAKKELKELWQSLHDPDKCGDLLAGL